MTIFATSHYYNLQVLFQCHIITHHLMIPRHWLGGRPRRPLFSLGSFIAWTPIGAKRSTIRHFLANNDDRHDEIDRLELAQLLGPGAAWEWLENLWTLWLKAWPKSRGIIKLGHRALGQIAVLNRDVAALPYTGLKKPETLTLCHGSHSFTRLPVHLSIPTFITSINFHATITPADMCELRTTGQISHIEYSYGLWNQVQVTVVIESSKAVWSIKSWFARFAIRRSILIVVHSTIQSLGRRCSSTTRWAFGFLWKTWSPCRRKIYLHKRH